MEPKKYLIDSNSVIDYLGNKFPVDGMPFMNAVVDATPIVSVITKIEVLGFNAPQEHNNLLISFMNDATVIDLVPEVVDQSIALRKLYKIKLPDAIIAATAIVYNLALITRNVKDFESIPELEVINPYILSN
jgi:predicted nucleic acid-binding protein